MSMTNKSLLVLAGLSGLLACSGPKALPEFPTQITAAGRDAEGEARGDTVAIGETTREKCGMSSHDRAPKFDFDSASLRHEGRESLDVLAQCMLSGALRNQRLRLVGHTDPRGEFDYNMALGTSRAQAVASYLVSRGVPSDRLPATSRGEMDAVGTDEPTWSLDRRVDVTEEEPGG